MADTLKLTVAEVQHALDNALTLRSAVSSDGMVVTLLFNARYSQFVVIAGGDEVLRCSQVEIDRAVTAYNQMLLPQQGLRVSRPERLIDYEWDVETIDIESPDRDDPEILDHFHAQRLIDLPWLLCDDQRLVLVRNDFRDGTLVRSWAYLDPVSRMLPKCFTDAGGAQTAFVPARFHREVAKVAAG